MKSVVTHARREAVAAWRTTAVVWTAYALGVTNVRHVCVDRAICTERRLGLGGV